MQIVFLYIHIYIYIFNTAASTRVCETANIRNSTQWTAAREIRTTSDFPSGFSSSIEDRKIVSLATGVLASEINSLLAGALPVPSSLPMHLEALLAAADAGVFIAEIVPGQKTLKFCDLWGREMPEEYEVLLHVKRPGNETQVVCLGGVLVERGRVQHSSSRNYSYWYKWTLTRVRDGAYATYVHVHAGPLRYRFDSFVPPLPAASLFPKIPI